MEIERATESLWYALRVRTKCEKVVAGALTQRDIHHYLPLYKTKTQWSDRVRTSFVPLFPGYVFAQFNHSQLHRLVSVPDFMHIVGRGSVPEPIEESDIEAVRRVIASGTGVGPWTMCIAGQTVEVIRGPLAGVRGVVVRTKGHDRLIVSIPMMQRSVSTEIDSFNLRLVEEKLKTAAVA